ncbi:ATP-dependent DNA ligase [Trametopsis cervina]|nr:ATP-dependent DNA ligase [Trametopsis cervina]
MAKRPAPPASPATPRKRRNAGKPPSDQPSLDSFFGTPRAASGTPGPSSSRKTQKGRADERDATTAASALSGDAALARRLAEEDGLDVDALRKLERKFSAAAVKKLDVDASTGPSYQVIDVDLLDDDCQERQRQPEEATLSPGVEAASGSKTLARTASIGSVPSSPTKSAPKFVGAALQETQEEYPALSVDPLVYSLDRCPWPPAASGAPYSFLAHTLSTLSGTRSRIAILNTLTNTLRTIIQYHPASLCPALYLLSNSLSPPYSPLELGLGPSIISKAIQDVSGLTPAALKRLYTSTGDPGDVAFEAKSNVRTLLPHPPLRVVGVHESLLAIARAKGSGAGKQKQAVVQRLLVSAKGEEIRYLVRTLYQNLRVGAVRTSILTALARALVLTPPSGMSSPFSSQTGSYASAELLAAVKPLPANPKKKIEDPARDELNSKFLRADGIVRKAYVIHPNYDHISGALLEAGLDGLAQRLPLTVGIPLLPTLGSPTRSLDEVYDRLDSQPFAAEFKYDGQRAQIHGARMSGVDRSVKIFSRHLEDMTDKYPDVVALVEQIFDRKKTLQSFIIDSEIVAIDPLDGSVRSFQELSNRARRDVNIADIKVPVCVFVFDLMYLNSEVLLEKPFRNRRSLLRNTFPPFTPEQLGVARFDHVQSIESEDGRESVEAFWQAAVNGRSEGLMIKLLDSGEVEEVNREGKSRRKPLPATYEPDKRTSAWLKLKKDYVTGIGDSLDLVPIGAWHGNGRKAQWWSPILLAVWDPNIGKHVAVCKCMSGFTDAFYKELRERYPEDSETCSKASAWDAQIETGGLRPQVYFEPREVWEIRGADITISPVSVAALGLVSESRGLSLRFPRFMKIRDDKSIDQASTPEFLAGMYRSQPAQGNKGRGGVDEGDLVDVDVPESELEDPESSESDV